MSQENVELHRHAVRAFNARDIEAMIVYCDPSIEFHTTFAALGGTYYGHEGIRNWHRDVEEVWGAEQRLEPEAYFDLGEHTLLFYGARARGMQSRADVMMQSAQVARWRDGLAIYFKAYAHRGDALGDLGVSVDELEPIEP